jgi:hypothetical protein
MVIGLGIGLACMMIGMGLLLGLTRDDHRQRVRTGPPSG